MYDFLVFGFWVLLTVLVVIVLPAYLFVRFDRWARCSKYMKEREILWKELGYEKKEIMKMEDSDIFHLCLNKHPDRFRVDKNDYDDRGYDAPSQYDDYEKPRPRKQKSSLKKIETQAKFRAYAIIGGQASGFPVSPPNCPPNTAIMCAERHKRDNPKRLVYVQSNDGITIWSR